MGYKPLTQKGKEYIKNAITKNGSNTFTGKNKYAVIGTTIPQGTLITSKAYDDNGVQTTDLNKFINLVIKWVEQYAKQYEIDANVLSAQQSAESRYLPWNYSQSGAIGFTQFTVTTIIDWIFTRKKLTDEEYDTIANGINGDVTKKSTFFTSGNQSQVYNQIRLDNKTKLFQNVVDNPKIMIHAQASLMGYLSGRNSKIAASTLFAYNRASGLSSTSYVDAISTLVNGRQSPKFPKQGKPYSEEGLKYVSIIFNLLNKEYGYKLDLAINDSATKEVYINTQNS